MKLRSSSTRHAGRWLQRVVAACQHTHRTQLSVVSKLATAPKSGKRIVSPDELPSATDATNHTELLPALTPSRQAQPGADVSASITSVQLLPPLPSFVAISAALAFSAIATDVFSPQSLHLFSAIDTSVHTWVNSNTSFAFRVDVANRIISNISIYTGIAALSAGSVWALLKQPSRALAPVALIWAAYFGAAGYVKKGEPLLLGTAKEFFHRARPSDWHASYSFPSGHSTAATFIIGALAFVICPLVLSLLEEDDRKSAASAPQEPDGQLQATMVLRAAAEFCQGNWQLVVGCWGLTATGRMLADVHWCSDTVAGLCFGSFVVAVLVGGVQLAESVGQQLRGSSGGMAEARDAAQVQAQQD